MGTCLLLLPAVLEEKSGACGTDRVSQLLSFSPEERSSGDVSELESLLTIKTKAELLSYAKSFGVKVRQSDKKAVILGRILSYCNLGLTAERSLSSTSEAEGSSAGALLLTESDRQLLSSLPSFSLVNEGWGKDCSLLSTFSFLHIYTYLIESRDNTFDEGKKDAYKSLKGYGYFADQAKYRQIPDGGILGG